VETCLREHGPRLLGPRPAAAAPRTPAPAVAGRGAVLPAAPCPRCSSPSARPARLTRRRAASSTTPPGPRAGPARHEPLAADVLRGRRGSLGLDQPRHRPDAGGRDVVSEPGRPRRARVCARRLLPVVWPDRHAAGAAGARMSACLGLGTLAVLGALVGAFLALCLAHAATRAATAERRLAQVLAVYQAQAPRLERPADREPPA